MCNGIDWEIEAHDPSTYTLVNNGSVTATGVRVEHPGPQFEAVALPDGDVTIEHDGGARLFQLIGKRGSRAPLPETLRVSCNECSQPHDVDKGRF